MTSTRRGGVSEGPWSGLNLATHVGDQPAHVAQNRQLLQAALGLTRPPCWLEQVHGVEVCELPCQPAAQADAASTDQVQQPCVVLTADCLPVLFTDIQGHRVAAAHAGWRGLAAGVLEASVSRFDDPQQVMAWLGPGIGPDAFEVGDEVRRAFVSQQPEAQAAFAPTRPGHWLADLYHLARLRLSAVGVDRVYGGGLCTYHDPQRFYSFRREAITGRMATIIWKES